jgi:beta-lactamase regulating signal transducer with metallopeptidase domain
MAETLAMLDSAGRLAWQASWHGAVLALLVLLSVRMLRRQLQPGWRSALWLLVCVRLAIPVAPSLPTSIHNAFRGASATVDGGISAPTEADARAQARPTAVLQSRDVPENGYLNVASAMPTIRSAEPPTSWYAGSLLWRAALCVWLVGFAVGGIRYGWGAWRLQRLIESCDEVREPSVLSLADECRRACGLAVRPTLKRAPGALGPTVAGFLQPTLLLSDETLRMDWKSLRFILLHEMRHIRTGDCLIAWVLRGLTAVHWFNPFCWLANRAWQAERELACDAWVLRHADADERRQYGHTLLRVLEQASQAEPALFVTGMASSPHLIERRIQDMKRPIRSSSWRHAAAILLLSALVLVGFTDSVRSQPAPATDPTASRPGHTAPPTNKPLQGSPLHAKQRRKITIVLAEHVILVCEAMTQNADLTEFRIVSWDQLLQLLREASKTDRIVPEIWNTNGSLSPKVGAPPPKQYGYDQRALQLLDLAKELKAPTWLLSFVQYNGSQRYDSIRKPADLKPDQSRLREGVVHLANGRPAVGATVVLQTHGKYDCSIYIDKTDLRDWLDEVWTKTDDHGRYHFYPKDDDYAVAALHPTGFGLATSQQVENGPPITLAPWGQIELKGNSETGLSATRTGEGKNAVRFNLQAFSHTGHTVPMPAGRVWIQRLTADRKTGDTLVVVGPGETKTVTIEPPARTPAVGAKQDKDAKPKS